METFGLLKSFCERFNVRYEVNPYYAEEEVYNYETKKFEKIQCGWWFGMENISGRKGKSEWNWVWFRCIGESLTEDKTFFFEERVSMINGKTYKGINEWLTATRTIRRRMGIQ